MLKHCYILGQKLLHFVLMLHCASVVTLCGKTPPPQKNPAPLWDLLNDNNNNLKSNLFFHLIKAAA